MTQPAPEQLEAEIEVQRAQLADTVDQLTQKLDVKAQAKARISRIQPMTYAAFAGAAILVAGIVLVAGSAMTSQSTQGIDRTEPTTPDPDDPRKPDAPTDLEKRTWWYVARKVRREFGDDQCTDLAAALTYYAVLAIFPAAIALTALLGLVGQVRDGRADGPRRVGARSASADVLGTIEPDAAGARRLPDRRAGPASIGSLVALWSASGYVGAFGRAMNRIYEIGEGRPFWKLRPADAAGHRWSPSCWSHWCCSSWSSRGPVAQSIGDAIGLGDQARHGLEHREVAGHAARR